MAKRPVPLTRKRQLWAEHRGGHTFRGKPLIPSAAAQARYEAALSRAIGIMTAETEREVRRLWADFAPVVTSGMDASLASQARILTNAMAQRFQAFFSRLAPGLANRMVTQVDAASKAGLHASLKELSGGLSLKTGLIDKRAVEVSKAAVTANVALIKSVPVEYFQRIQGALSRAIQQDGKTESVMEAVEHAGAVTKKRAELIARDQTSKATSALNKARLKALGMDKFEWLHSGGGKEPRKLHEDMSGNIYSFDDPPVIDENTGERGLPGQLINCRCRIIPVIDFGEEDEDE